MRETTTPARRYAKLVNDLGADRGFQRGWMTRAADLLGVHNSYVSLLHGGQRLDVGGSVIARAIEKMSIDPKYFFDESLDEPSYRDFQKGQSTMTKEQKPEQPRDALTTKFLELVDYLGERKGKAHGWKSAVATELGIHPVHLSRLMNDSSRSITRGTALEAADLAKINIRYFDTDWTGDISEAFLDTPKETPAVALTPDTLAVLHTIVWMLQDVIARMDMK